MTAGRATARDAYLASMTSSDELATRRAAERSGIPDDDPMWLLLAEVRRACVEVNQCTRAAQQAASDAAARIESATAPQSRVSLDDGYVARIAATAGAKIAADERVVAAVASAVRGVEGDATRALRTVETSLRDLMRRRAATPFASLVFAFALGVASACAAVWGGYHTGIGYGQDLGYRTGFHDARIYDRSHQ